VPGLTKDDPWIDVGHWNVPIDDSSTNRFVIYSLPSAGPKATSGSRAISRRSATTTRPITTTSC
jgi:hypothetical protein